MSHRPYPISRTAFTALTGVMPYMEQSTLTVVLPDQLTVLATIWVQPPLPEKLPR